MVDAVYFHWKYARGTNHLTLVYKGYIVCIGLEPAPSGYWVCISQVKQMDWFPLAGKFVDSIRSGVEWSESFVSARITEDEIKKDGAA